MNHRHYFMIRSSFAAGSSPIAEDVASRVLSLPTGCGLPLEDVSDIARNVLAIA